MSAPVAVELDAVHVRTRRWFLALALADFTDARDAALEAQACGLIGEAKKLTRAAELAALFYARPFHYCSTPSGRTRLKLPKRFLEQLDWRYAAVHFQTLRARDRFIVHRDLADSHLMVRASPDRREIEFGATLIRPVPRQSDLADLVGIIDEFIASIMIELVEIAGNVDLLPATAIGTKGAMTPAPED